MSVRIIRNDFIEWLAERRGDFSAKRSEMDYWPLHRLRNLREHEDVAKLKQSFDLAIGEMARIEQLVRGSWVKIVHLNFKIPSEKAEWFGKAARGEIFIYMGKAYCVTGPYSQDQAQLLLEKWIEKQMRYLEGDSTQSGKRETIPEHVRHEVWRRDQGKCVKCGSVNRLEFDHLIPWSKGGANTARNLQLLCELCNRKKGAGLA